MAKAKRKPKAAPKPKRFVIDDQADLMPGVHIEGSTTLYIRLSRSGEEKACAAAWAKQPLYIELSFYAPWLLDRKIYGELGGA